MNDDVIACVVVELLDPLPIHTGEDRELYIMIARMFYPNGPSRPALFPYSVAFDDGIACKYIL